MEARGRGLECSSPEFHLFGNGYPLRLGFKQESAVSIFVF